MFLPGWGVGGECARSLCGVHVFKCHWVMGYMRLWGGLVLNVYMRRGDWL